MVDLEQGQEASANPDEYGDLGELPSDDGPLVGKRTSFEALEAFYLAGSGNEVFLEKIAGIKRRSPPFQYTAPLPTGNAALASASGSIKWRPCQGGLLQRSIKLSACGRYEATRCVRGDGNCFYRSLMFCLFERVIGCPTEATELKRKLEHFFSEGVCGKREGSLGYEKDAIEMFFDECTALLEPLEKDGVDAQAASKSLLDAFQDHAKSNSIVVFARLVCSCYMSQNEALYGAFLECDGLSVREFCLREVEPLGKEVEQLQMMATIEALGAPIRVVYLDRSPGGLNAHDLPEDGATGPRITMLYRPGHYDILYPVPGAP